MASAKRSSSSSAEFIASNDDLLQEIFLCLPPKTVFHLRTVNKHWHSLISSPEFRRIHCSHNFNFNPSGLFLYDPFHPIRSKSIIFPHHHHPCPNSYPSIFPPKHSKKLLESCNGLFLYYCGTSLLNESTKFYIGNPTTKQSALLPSPAQLQNVSCFALSLAFDPSLSPHYKVVYLWWSESSREFYCHVYSSDTRSAEPSARLSYAGNRSNSSFSSGVYCNGAIHWLDGSDFLVYYNINEECLYTKKLPSLHSEMENMAKYRICAATQHNLMIVDNIYYDSHQLVVFEMSRDYLGVVEKYRVGVDQVLSPFPGIQPPAYLLVDAFQGSESEGIVIVMSIKNTVIAHHTKDNSIQVLLKLHSKAKRNPIRRHVLYKYFETICPV